MVSVWRNTRQNQISSTNQPEPDSRSVNTYLQGTQEERGAKQGNLVSTKHQVRFGQKLAVAVTGPQDLFCRFL